MNPPRPTAMKVLMGTARKDRMNANEPQPKVGALPPPFLPRQGPAWVAWNRLAPILTATRVLTECDGDALAVTCMALEEYLSARHAPDQWRRADAAAKRYQAGLLQFGLTPSSRVRVSAVAPDVADDPFDEWLARKAASDASTPPELRRKPTRPPA